MNYRNQIQNQKQQPPPPPSSSPRYLLTIPKSIKTLHDLGIRFVPFHESHSNSSRSIGAKISYMKEGLTNNENDNILQTWISQYKMKVGDVLFKINDEVVKTRSFASIMNRLDSVLKQRDNFDGAGGKGKGKGSGNGNGVLSLIIERKGGCDSKYHDDNLQQAGAAFRNTNGVQSPQDARDCPQSLSMDLSHEHNVLNSIFSAQKTKAPQQNMIRDIDESESLIVDSSISCSNCSSSSGSHLPFPFEGASRQIKVTQDDVPELIDDIGDADYSLSDDSIGYDLSAIPEGAESDISRESDAPLQRKSYQSPLQQKEQQYQEYQPTEDAQHNNNNNHHPPVTTIYRSQNSIISNDFSRSHLASPSFSYSDSECLLSPLGTKISANASNSKSIKAGELSLSDSSLHSDRPRRLVQQHLSREDNKTCRDHKNDNSDDNSNDNNNHDTFKISKTQQRGSNMRSIYMSPESEHLSSIDNSTKSSYKGRSVQFSSTIHKKQNISTYYHNYDHTTPNNQIKMEATNFQSPLSEIHPTSSLESCSVSTVFLSPLSNLPTTTTPVSRNGSQNSSRRDTSQSYSYFNNVPVYMLDYNFVRKCTSYQELETIVKALDSSKEGEPQQFPSLLRLAKTKLKDIAIKTGKGDDDNNNNNNDDQEYHDAIEEKSIQEGGNDNHEGAMLKKSGIPSHIHVEIQTLMDGDQQYFNQDNSGAGSKAIVPGSVQDNHDDGEIVENMNSIVIAHAELQDEMEKVLDERDIVQKRLAKQIHILEGQLHSLNTYVDTQATESNYKIESLTASKRVAEEEVSTLKATIVCSSREARQVLDQLKDYEGQLEKLQVEIQMERDSKRIEIEKSSSIQNQLEKKVLHLTRQHELNEEDNQLSRELIELELRAEYSATSQIDKARINELEKCLSHTREELRLMYEENEAISKEFAKIGKNASSPSQLLEILKECTAAEACANALAKALTESESELCSIISANKFLKKKYEDLLNKNNEIEAENEELAALMKVIKKELKSSHNVIHNLHQELDKHNTQEKDVELLRAKWVDAKKIYQAKIDELKSNLTNAGNMVPLDKYHEAVECTEVLRRSLKEKETEMERLSSRIRELEGLIEKSSKENRPQQKLQDFFSPASGKSVRNPSTLSASKSKKSRRESGKMNKGPKRRLALAPLHGNIL